LSSKRRQNKKEEVTLNNQTNEALKSRRIAQKMTMQKIADFVGCAKSSYGNIEKGRRSPSLKTAQRIAEALESTVDALFSSEIP
jgi:putative transcriptional regulator